MSKNIGILFFSPTNTTKKICVAIAQGMSKEQALIINITLPEVRTRFSNNSDNILAKIDHLIVGAPVYEGKLPLQVIECLKSIDGKGKGCTAVVLYGNRDYGIALKNMVELLSVKGFKVVTAGAFIGQHSYSDIIPVAVGRPDEKDIELARDFGKKSLTSFNALTVENIPVQIDIFSKSKKYYPLNPVFNSKDCIQCGICAEHCPIGIISPETGNFINKEAKNNCIGCMACVYNCRNNARIAKPNFFMNLLIKNILRKASKQRLEPLTILA